MEKREPLKRAYGAIKEWFIGILKKHQIKARFGLVGIWNTIFGYLLYVGLETFFSRLFMTRYLAYMPALVLANILSIINAYIFHKYIT